MSAGTLTLTNNSALVSGAGTSFSTELAAGDFVVTTVGGIPYTLPVKTIESNTGLTLVSNFTGPTQSGAAWSAVPRVALNMVTAALVAQSVEALRGLNYDKQNWQQFFTADGDVTITLPDTSQTTGPSAKKLINSVSGKADKTALDDYAKNGANDDITSLTGLTTPLSMTQGGLGASNPAEGRAALGLKSAATAEITTSYTDTTPGRILKVGDFGVGRRVNPTIGTLFEKSLATGVYKVDTTTLGWGYPYSMLLRMQDRDNGTGSQEYQQQAFAAIAVGGGSEGMRFLSYADGGLFAWQKVYSTVNTTVDSSGNLKVASPVVAIFGDGSFRCNPESEGVTVVRMATGKYHISGCTGLNSDAAWGGVDGGFEIPVDRNKQARIWLDYKVNPDGSILVRTYHRVHESSPSFAQNRLGTTDVNGVFTETVADREPVDIPADSFVSVRVEMPSDSIWNQRQEDMRMAMEKAEREREDNQQSTQS